MTSFQDHKAETQPTPGPWHWFAHEHDVDGFYIKADGQDGDIVNCWTEANARLISAAPDLLQSARAFCVAYVSYLRGAEDINRPNVDHLVDNMLEAVYSATGKRGLAE